MTPETLNVTLCVSVLATHQIQGHFLTRMGIEMFMNEHTAVVLA